MNLSLIRSMTRSAVFELENGLCYRPAHPFTVTLNGKTVYEACQTNVFSLFSLLPGTEYSDTLFAEEFSAELKGIDPEHAALYSICEQHDVGIAVMKPFAGGRLFDAKRSPFGVSLTPVQCIHYALTRPAVSSVLCGYDTKEQVDQAVAYENASHEEKDF